MDNNDIDNPEALSDVEEEQTDVVQQGSEDEGEDLLGDNWQADYAPNAEYDQYERDGLDDSLVDEGSIGEAAAARRAADAELNRRDRRRGKHTPAALDEDADYDEDDARERARKRGKPTTQAAEDDEEDPEGPVPVKIEEVRGRLTEWIVQDPVQAEIARRFRVFLKTYKDEMGNSYKQKIQNMANEGRKSLEVDYRNLSKAQPLLAIWSADAPRQMFEIFNSAARQVAAEMFPERLEAIEAVGGELEVYVRLTGLPVSDTIRELRNHHLNCLVKVSGVVTRRTGVFPQLKLVKYDCVKCGYTMGPFAQNSEHEVKPMACPQCQSKGPFQVNTSETVYRDYQKLTLQESPGVVPAGRLPRSKEVILINDLIDCARPGEEVEITGIYCYGYDVSLNMRNSFPVFSTHLEANHVCKREDLFSIYALTDEDKHEIITLSRDPKIGERIIRSIAPSIYGHENIKTGLALALFGGLEKRPSPAHRLRGDINVLLLGDPGVAKSQFLKYVEKTAMRAVYTTGKSASAVGLTAGVHRDPVTREWTLEGGALVLADKGVCLIDEFDKMNDQDRVSIHEAMEQQTISISKAGIVTTLQARCAVIAAANPIGGRYDPSRTFAENVELSDPILSRFDFLCVVRDIVDPVMDTKLAEFVVNSHMSSHPVARALAEDQDSVEVDPEILPQTTLRKYITYAKQHCKPALQQADYERIADVYSKLRSAGARTHGMPVAVRHLESIIRMSEAHARMHMRHAVNDDDVNMAIKMMVQSFIQTQKYSVHKMLEKSFRQYIVNASDYHQLLISLLRALCREEQRVTLAREVATDVLRIPIRSFEEKAREHEISDLKTFYQSHVFTNAGFRMENNHIIYCM